MKRIIGSMFGAGLVILALAATVSAADPVRTRAQDTIPDLLGMTHEEVMALRQEGQSLAQIAESKDVDPQVLIDALVARWEVRITARVANGGLDATEAETLRAQVETQARDMVYKTTLGGMHGATVGAGPGTGAANGAGNAMMGRGAGPMGHGTGTCTGNGPAGAGQQ